MDNLSCWWKNGKAYPLDDPYNQTHLEYVLKHLDVFGFDEDWINRLVKESGEIITEEDGDFTEGAEALKENLYYYGWIRVRHWSTNFVIECWDSNSKDFKDCIWYLYQEYKKSGKKRFSVDVESVKGKGGAYYESEIDYKYGGRPLTELLSSKYSLTEQEIINSLITNSNNSFEDWFSNSKVVDDVGNPLVVYHGTSAQFDSFQPSSDGIFFTSKKSTAESYTGFDDLTLNNVEKEIIKYPNINSFDFNDFKTWLNNNGFDIKQSQEEVYRDWEYKTNYGYKITNAVGDSTFITAYAPHQIYFALRDLKSKSKARVISAYLKIENPLIKDLNFKHWFSDGGTLNVGRLVMSGEYDGAILKNVREGDGSICDVYIVANNSQIWQIK